MLVIGKFRANLTVGGIERTLCQGINGIFSVSSAFGIGIIVAVDINAYICASSALYFLNEIASVHSLFIAKGGYSTRLFVEAKARKVVCLYSSALYGDAHNSGVGGVSDTDKGSVAWNVFLKFKAATVKVKIAYYRNCSSAYGKQTACRGCIFSVGEGNAVKVKVKLLYLGLIIVIRGIPRAEGDKLSAVKYDFAVSNTHVGPVRALCVAVEHTGRMLLLKVELVVSEVEP